jgi:hypothetical protein
MCVSDGSWWWAYLLHAYHKGGRLTVIEHDLLEVVKGALAGLCGCWVTRFYFASIVAAESFVALELGEFAKACKLREGMKVDIFRCLNSRCWKG